ncbi:hypothetical protein [Kriegella aquimaris]|nr:hypothetical protein [Kriegella aquimaris]
MNKAWLTPPMNLVLPEVNHGIKEGCSKYNLVVQQQTLHKSHRVIPIVIL